MNAIKTILFTLLSCCSLVLNASGAGVFHDVDVYPASLSKECRNGTAKLYDECGSQLDVFNAALAQANRSGKSLLVVYGAEWCIWCHVFDKHVRGEYKKFKYNWVYDGEVQKWTMREKSNKSAKEKARILNKYVAQNFVIAHIESEFSADAIDVLDASGIDSESVWFLPFIFSTTDKGKYADYMLAYDAIPGLEIREDSGREYRGFDRTILMAELMKLRKRAIEKSRENQ